MSALVLALASVVSGPLRAGASTWDITLAGTSTNTAATITPFTFTLHVELADPSGGATTTISGVPAMVFRDPATLFVTVNTSFTDATGCLHVPSISASGPIETTAAGSTASGSISGEENKICPDTTRTKTFAGTLTAQSLDLTLPGPPTAQAVSGTVTVKTPLSTQPLTAGSSVSPGSLIQTGSDGSATLAFAGGTMVSVAVSSQVTLLPSTLPTGDDIVLSQISGRLTHSVVGTPPSPDRYRVLTPTATIQPIGTDFTTQYGQTGSIGSTIVSVQRGLVEVTDRTGQLTTLTAGMQANFDDTVPRVIPILPVDRGSIPGGVVDTFSWTAFPGAAGYLFEYTLNPAGFARANPSAAESSRDTILLFAPAFSQANGTVEFPVRVPAGLLPPTAPAWWRVFAVDVTGAVLPGSTASDASRVFIQ